MKEHQAANRGDPYFALTSDDKFVISLDNHDEPLILDATTTRAMFRWLDRLGGLGLVDKLADQEQTA